MSSSAKKLPATARKQGSHKTREALIFAAERLFARHGIDAVSLRQINAEGGQRNLSAAHYHFGSKEALITAIYDYRMERVNHKRLAIIDRIEAAGRQLDVRALVEAIVMPIVEEMEESEGGADYIRFLSQVMGHPELSLEGLWSSRHAEGLTRILGHLRSALPDVPAPIRGQRFGLMWEQVIHALADGERLRENAREVNQKLFVQNLVDVVAGGLNAPVGRETHRHLKRS